VDFKQEDGQVVTKQQEAKPVLIEFPLVEEKHKLLKMSKQLRQDGLRLDDWLTELQQKETCTLDADLQTLKGRGYKLFFRGSVLIPIGLLQQQGMCLPEGQSRHCSICCTGHQLSFGLHSQQFSLLVFEYLNSAFCK
jgi:hypothetical protein